MQIKKYFILVFLIIMILNISLLIRGKKVYASPLIKNENVSTGQNIKVNFDDKKSLFVSNNLASSTSIKGSILELSTEGNILRYVIDMNNDGYKDIVEFCDSGIFVSLNLGNNSFGEPQCWIFAYGKGSGWNSQNEYPRYVVDVNNDGYPDIVGFGTAGVLVSLNSGKDSFEPAQCWVSAYGKVNGWSTQNEYPEYVVDVNNDGYPDIVGFGTAGVLVSLNSGKNSFEPAQCWVSDYGKDSGWNSQNEYPRYVVDVNNDGYPDIVGFGTSGVLVSLNSGKNSFEPAQCWVSVYGKGSGWNSQNEYPRYIVDVNNDGYPDIVGFGTAGVLVSLNSGKNSFEPAQCWVFAYGKVNGWSTQNEYPGYVVDVNNDGYPDIVGFGTAGVLVSLNSGKNSFEPPQCLVFDYGKGSGWSTQNEYPRYVVDVNNDGYPDIVGFGTLGTLVSLNQKNNSFGNIQCWRTNIVSTDLNYTYEYDQSNYRLLYILINGTRTIKFNYDANGNLISKEKCQ